MDFLAVTARKSIYYWWNWATHRYHHEDLDLTRRLAIADRASAVVWVGQWCELM